MTGTTDYVAAAEQALAGGTYPVYAHLKIDQGLAVQCLADAMADQQHTGTDLGVKELASLKAEAAMGHDGPGTTHADTWEHIGKHIELRRGRGEDSEAGLQAMMMQWLSDNAARSFLWTIVHSDEALIDGGRYDQLLRQAAAVLAGRAS